MYSNLRESIEGTSVSQLQTRLEKHVQDAFTKRKYQEECLFYIANELKKAPAGFSVPLEEKKAETNDNEASDAPWMADFHAMHLLMFSECVFDTTLLSFPFSGWANRSKLEKVDDYFVRLDASYSNPIKNILDTWILLLGLSHRETFQNSNPELYIQSCCVLFDNKAISQNYFRVVSQRLQMSATRSTTGGGGNKIDSSFSSGIGTVYNSWIQKVSPFLKDWIEFRRTILFPSFETQEELKSFLETTNEDQQAWLLACPDDAVALFVFLQENENEFGANRWFEFLKNCTLSELSVFSTVKPTWMIRSWSLTPWHLLNYHFLGLAFASSLNQVQEDRVSISPITQTILENAIRFLAPVLTDHKDLFQRVYGCNNQNYYSDILQSKHAFLRFTYWQKWAAATCDGLFDGHLFSVLLQTNSSEKKKPGTSFVWSEEAVWLETVAEGLCINSNLHLQQQSSEAIVPFLLSDSKNETTTTTTTEEEKKRNQKQDSQAHVHVQARLRYLSWLEREFWRLHPLQARFLVVLKKNSQNSPPVFVSKLEWQDLTQKITSEEKTNEQEPLSKKSKGKNAVKNKGNRNPQNKLILAKLKSFRALPIDFLCFLDAPKQNWLKQEILNDVSARCTTAPPNYKKKGMNFFGSIEEEECQNAPSSGLPNKMLSKIAKYGNRYKNQVLDRSRKIKQDFDSRLNTLMQMKEELQNKMTTQMERTTDGYSFSYGIGFVVLVFVISVILLFLVLFGLIFWKNSHIEYDLVTKEVVTETQKEQLEKHPLELGRDFDVPKNSEFYYYSSPHQSEGIPSRVVALT